LQFLVARLVNPDTLSFGNFQSQNLNYTRKSAKKSKANLNKKKIVQENELFRFEFWECGYSNLNNSFFLNLNNELFSRQKKLSAAPLDPG